MRLLFTLLLLVCVPACVTGRAAPDFVNPCDGDDPAACARFVAAVRGAGPEQPATEQHVTRACLAGDAEACHLHARILMSKSEEAQGRRGFMLASRLCQEGHGPACLSAGGSPLCDVPADCDALRERGCGAGEGRACTLLAQGKEPARQVNLLDKACASARPDALACHSLGNWYRTAEQPAPERAKAAPLLERACGLGVPSACFELALLSRESPGGAERAASLLARACAAGEDAACGEALLEPCRQGQAAACRGLGALQVQDEEAMKRRTQALEGACSRQVAEACSALAQQGRGAWARACELGDAAACVEAATELSQAASGTTEEGKPPGLEFLERGCASKHPARHEACEHLATWLLADERNGDPKRGLELLERGCQAWHADSCSVLGDTWWWARGVERHRLEGLKHYARHCELQTVLCSSEVTRFQVSSQACEEGSAPACLELGSLLDASDEPLKADDWAVVSTAYQRACELGAAEGCMALARAFVEGRGQDRSLERVIESFARACKLGHVEGCNRQKQYSALQAGCAADKPDACQQLADFQLAPPASAADQARGVALLERHCQRGAGSACLRLAELFGDGQWGFEPELHRVLGYQEQALKAGAEFLDSRTLKGIQASRAGCDRGDAMACHELADDYLTPLYRLRKPEASSSPDWAHAKAALEKACGPGSAEPCVELARLLLTGARSLRAPDAGLALLETHCARASRDCRPLLESLTTGTVPEGSPQQRLGLLRKTCDAGMSEACFLLGKAHEEGLLGLAPSAPSAVEVYRKACDAGSGEACRRLER
jgi:hypothetical protein